MNRFLYLTRLASSSTFGFGRGALTCAVSYSEGSFELCVGEQAPIVRVRAAGQ
ncbi:MAG: hypothetical protein VX475_10930 [Myxococcota bacterium]|nr:hypothetical protein [Myxococcota bacterium]